MKTKRLPMITRRKSRDLLGHLVAVGAIIARVGPEEITGKNTTRAVCVARDAVMLEARLSGYSSLEIGLAFNRDHTSVLDAAKRAGSRRGGAA